MNETKMLNDLQSGDVDRILDALWVLASERKTFLSKQIVDIGRQLFDHEDADIRHASVFALGVHWALSDVFEAVLRIARKETDHDVRQVAIRALGRYGQIHKALVCRELAKIVQEKGLPSDIRGIAYLSLLDVEGLLTPRDKATLPEDINALEVDWEVVRRWNDAAGGA